MSRWDQGKWWDQNNSEPTKKHKRCDHCVTKPRLVSSGQGEPKSLKCPVCKDLFNGEGIRFDPAALAAQRAEQAKKWKEEEEETWESIWGATAPFMKICYCTKRFGGENVQA